MEKRINIAELLKDCPQGMELDCAMWDDAKFDKIETGRLYPIRIQIGGYLYESFTEFGQWNHNDKSKCVIFPKGKTTWEGFVPPCKFKDGDIITCTKCEHSFVAIFKKQTKDFIFHSYAMCTLGNKPFVQLKEGASSYVTPRLATEEEREALFKAIKENGYSWNAETKTLEKILEPKQSKYPKTCEECCDILDVEPYSRSAGYKSDLITAFRNLLICRDAYWKIAGEQMGLGKSWEPDWRKADERKYCIVNTEGSVTKWIQKTTNKILAFPTAEMRDAFYEDFKELIELCKELL